MNGSRPFLSVILPAYNEAENIKAGVLEQVAQFLEKQTYPYEVILVDDGSHDDTVSLAGNFIQMHKGFKIMTISHCGKAGAVEAGLLSAQGEIVLFSDLDQATPIHEINRFLPYFSQGCDIVIGSRGKLRRNAPTWRKFLSQGQIIMRNLILGFRQITDTQCGFKAFRNEVIRPILDRMSLYGGHTATCIQGATVTSGFDVELLFVARKLGYKISEVSVEWDYRHSRRVNLLKDALRGTQDLIRIRVADMSGVYNHKDHPRKTSDGL